MACKSIGSPAIQPAAHLDSGTQPRRLGTGKRMVWRCFFPGNFVRKISCPEKKGSRMDAQNHVFLNGLKLLNSLTKNTCQSHHFVISFCFSKAFFVKCPGCKFPQRRSYLVAENFYPPRVILHQARPNSTKDSHGLKKT